MRKTYPIILLIILSLFSIALHAQSWTKVSTNLDSLWTTSVKYFNKGDTIVYYGSKTGSGAFNAKQFYVSTDGAYNFTRDFTKLDAIGYQAIYPLPINKTLIGFKNSPNLGSYSFLGPNNWGSLLDFSYGLWGEINAGTLIFQSFGSTYGLIIDYPSGNITQQINLTLELISTYNSGNRLLLGGKKNNVIKYVDNGNFGAVQTATIESLGLSASVVRFFNSGTNLYAVVASGQDYLYKSSDMGASWTLQPTNYFRNSVPALNLVSTFTIGTPNGNIYFLTNAGNSDDVYLSTDGGVTANKIGTGLPTNGTKIGPTIGKLLTNGNKVWYQVCAASTTDYVTTDTNIAGLYLFNNATTTINSNAQANEKLSVFTNDTKTQLFVKSPVGIKYYRIFTTDAKQVASSNFYGESIAISDLKKGIYFIEITNVQNKILTSKFFIN